MPRPPDPTLISANRAWPVRRRLYAALAVGVAASALLPIVRAADYRMELLVFEHRYPETDGELLPAETPGLADAIWLDFTAVPLLSEAGFGSWTPHGYYAPLPAASYMLHSAFRTLERIADYRALVHVGWNQPGHRRARAVRIAYADISCVTEPESGPPLPRLDGTVRLRDAGRLYADVDLLLRPCAADSGAGESVSLRESRRVLLNRIYYFDHPIFGVLLQVTRSIDGTNEQPGPPPPPGFVRPAA